MKKLILTLLVAISFLSAQAQTYGWIVLNTDSIPGTPDFSDVFFVNDDTGWITTSTYSEIYRTNDGAISFSIQTTPLGGTSAIHMLDENNGYSGGIGGWVYKTSNGGLNWNTLSSMGTFLDISFPPGTSPSNPIGYACGDNGRVWEITSTLTNLNSPSSSTFRGISAPSVNNVWVCGGGSIFYYNGSTFTGQSSPGGTFNDIHFINNQEGWVVGDAGVIGHTINGGNYWVTQINPDTLNRSLIGVFFLDSYNGWTVGAYDAILSTTDGGTTWAVEGAGLTFEPLIGVHFTSPNNGYIVGIGKTLLKYTQISGIEEQDVIPDITFYPNPVEEELFISFPSDHLKVETVNIIDPIGKIVKSESFKTVANGVSIHVGDLETGIYFCVVLVDGMHITRKIIVL